MKKYLLVFFGAMLLLPAAFEIERLIVSAVGSLELSYFWMALTEELLKILVVLSVVFIFSEPKSEWIKLGFFSALGFALLENFVFAINIFLDNGLSGVLANIFSRTFLLATPLHIVTTFIAVKGFKKDLTLGILATLLVVDIHMFFNLYVNDLMAGWGFLFEKYPLVGAFLVILATAVVVALVIVGVIKLLYLTTHKSKNSSRTS